jgi:hypothetical protein
MSQVNAQDGTEILDLLARYAQVLDNREWSEAASVFTPDVQFGRNPVMSTGIEMLQALIGDAPATHGHNTTDVILDQRPDGTIKAWSKFYIVRGDGTVGSGDYQDTLVRTPEGWRIAQRDASRGNRLDTDPTGGPSRRTFDFASWLGSPKA